MSLRLLLRLRETGIPYRSADKTEIIQIDMLAAAGLITAKVPTPVDGKYLGEAVVYSITDRGRAVEKSMRETARYS